MLEPGCITRPQAWAIQQTAVEVHVDDPRGTPPASRGSPGRRADTGVVDQDVDPPGLGHRGATKAVHDSGSATSVVTVRARRPVPGPARRSSSISVAAPQRHVGTGFGEGLGEGHAETARRAGHHRDLVVEPEEVGDRHGRTLGPARIRAGSPSARELWTKGGGRCGPTRTLDA